MTVDRFYRLITYFIGFVFIRHWSRINNGMQYSYDVTMTLKMMLGPRTNTYTFVIGNCEEE